jgi:hypothetical protein
MNTIKPPTPGESAHWLVTGQTHLKSSGNTGAISQRGASFTIDAAFIEQNTDRFGRSWVNDLHNPNGQIARWGRVVFAPGPAPEGMDSFTLGSVEVDFARDDARRAALAIPDARERQMALKAVTAKFGIQSSQVSVELDGGRFR